MLTEKEKDKLYFVLQTGILQTYIQSLRCETQESFHEMYSGLGNMLHFSIKLLDFFAHNKEGDLPETVQNVLHEVISGEIKSCNSSSKTTLDIEQLSLLKQHLDVLEGILPKLKTSKKEVNCEEAKLVTLI